MTGIQAFNSAGTSVIEVQAPSQQPGKQTSWVRVSKGIGKHARHFLPTELDHQTLKAASAQQSLSCGRPRAQETGGNSPVQFQAAS